MAHLCCVLPKCGYGVQSANLAHINICSPGRVGQAVCICVCVFPHVKLIILTDRVELVEITVS
jgi:hypothetical protein